ncbi:MAG: hypothetical protein JOZ73_12295 [Solirubrobacterales bacterium]|nr:hypothetical protein [Solirubrobacterales bacterium]MBV9311609.1 hypothetical protein [Solirubrobacterales bacterium]
MQSKLLPLTQRDTENRLHNALSETAVFHSPVRDYRGRADVAHILMTIGRAVGEIEPQYELADEREVVTIVSAAHGDRRMSGVLHETYDELGRVEDATLLLRPLSALLEGITAMRAALEQTPLPSTLAAR